MEDPAKTMHQNIKFSFNRIEDSISDIQNLFNTKYPLQTEKLTIHKFDKPCLQKAQNEQFRNELTQKITNAVSLNVQSQLKIQEDILIEQQKKQQAKYDELSQKYNEEMNKKSQLETQIKNQIDEINSLKNRQIQEQKDQEKRYQDLNKKHNEEIIKNKKLEEEIRQKDDRVKQEIQTNQENNLKLRDLNNQLSTQSNKIRQLQQQLEDADQTKNYSKQLTFSKEFKQQDIQLQENGKIAFASENMWQVCVCDQPIPKQSVVRFKFQILQMHQLYSGICFRDIISKNYRGYVSDIGHGYYLMCKDGYVYSHHDKEKNGKSLGFKYAVNDIIEITVDLKNQIINWSNQGKNLSYTLNIENKSELYPCFRMASSKVSLIER